MRLLIYLTLVTTLFFVGCKKDKTDIVDYRTQFTGNFIFTQTWSYGGPTGSGSSEEEHLGSIRLYQESDEKINHEMDNIELPRDNKIVITLDTDKITFSQIDESGVFVPRDEDFPSTGNDLKQSGYFSENRDTVHISIEFGQGLGWEEHDILGIRQ